MSCKGCNEKQEPEASEMTPCDGWDGYEMSEPKPDGQEDIACGITSAPRPIPTLGRCLDSVARNGIKPTVFAEPDTCFKGVAKWVPRVYRDARLGVFYNWARMTETLLQKNTQYILTLQDDAELSPVALTMMRRFMDRWPKNCCMLSLYTPPSYELPDENVGFSFVDQNLHMSRKLLGAVAWLFKRETLIRVRNTQDVCGTPKARAMERKANEIAKLEGRVNTQIIAGWRGNHDKTLVDRLDIALGRGLIQSRMVEYVHTPSLCQHIAETSSIGHAPARHKGVHATSVLLEAY